MRLPRTAAALGLLAACSVSLAQTQPVAFLQAPVADAPAPVIFPVGNPYVGRAWADFEYLLWRFSPAPNPTPLVTTSNAADVGVLGAPSTQVLFGGDSYSAGWQSGFRLTLGGWIDNAQQLGVEASGFYFMPRTPTNFSRSTTGVDQVLAIPFNNITPGGGIGGFIPLNVAKAANGENAILISGNSIPLIPFGNKGAIAVTSSTEFFGAELNGVFNLSRTARTQLNLIAGFRYVDLHENLNIDTAEQFSLALGNRWDAVTHDHFGTRNQFYGGQLGLKGEWSNSIVFINVTGKIAFGVNHETVDINGSFSDPLPTLFTVFGAGNTGGILTQPSNIGRTNQNRFIVIPEIALQTGVDVTRNFRLIVGYDAVYLSSVVRPGNQIDRNLNLSQTGTTFGGAIPPLVGQPGPHAAVQPFQLLGTGRDLRRAVHVLTR